jgi:hypothetical protein
MYKYLCIDTEFNKLLCSTNLVGLGELVEIHEADQNTPRQACTRILRKLADVAGGGEYVVHISYDGHDAVGLTYTVGERSVLRVLARNRSGMLRRRFSNDEKAIVNIEKAEKFIEKKIVRAKTGSVRRKHE